MDNVKILKKRIKELERKVQELEKDKAFMDALYKSACEMVGRHEKVTIISLQKKFLIDIERATALIDRLRLDGHIF
jgi:DNA segregation ATPase FtsK/SpoIIIE-like protein